MGPNEGCGNHRCNFGIFRAKVSAADLLSASMLKILEAIKFTGRLTVVVQNGRILKSGYEEGYFTRRSDDRLA